MAVLPHLGLPSLHVFVKLLKRIFPKTCWDTLGVYYLMLSSVGNWLVSDVPTGLFLGLQRLLNLNTGLFKQYLA